jgi:hypothetical protein
VSIRGDLALVGASVADHAFSAGSNEGNAYVYAFNGTSWLQQQALTSYRPEFGEAFGQSVALASDQAFVGGAYYSPPSGRPGAVYPFVLAPDCNDNDVPDVCDIQTGASPDVNDDGIPDECQLPCPADVPPVDGMVNVLDLLAVINAWGPCRAPCPPACPADITGSDCQVNVLDLLAVINAWGPCP